RRRKKIKSFFRRRVRRKNTLRGASVESFATWAPRRSPAKRVRWGEEEQRSERRLPPAAGDGMRSLCRRRAERSESPLAEKASAFFDSLSSQANAWLFPCVKKPRMAEKASAFFAGFTS